MEAWPWVDIGRKRLIDRIWAKGGIARVGRNTWMVARYELSRQALEDRRILVEPPPQIEQESNSRSTRRHPRIPRSDSAESDTIKSALRVGVSVRLEQIEREMKESVRNTLHSVTSRNVTDAVTEIARPIAEAGLFLTLGVPRNDWEGLSHLGRKVAAGPSVTMSEKAAKELYAADIAVQEYFLQFCEGFPHGDGLANDVMSAANGCLNQELLASSMALLTEAGLATTSDLLTSIILMSPWLADTLASGELRKGLQEVARASSPVHTATARYIAEDVSLGDAKLQRGDRVLILLDAANHDPLAFECPFTLNVIHTNNRNIAFGSGRHRCPGSKLARVLSESVAFTLLEEMGLTARIAGPLSRAPTASGVGISAAPVEVIRAVE